MKSTAQPDLKDFLKNLEDHPWAYSTPWLDGLRDQSRQRVISAGLPTSRDADWAFTDINPIFMREYSWTAGAVPIAPERLTKYLNPDEINIVFINGFYAPSFSNIRDLPEGVMVLPVKEALDRDLPQLRAAWERLDPQEKPLIAFNKALSYDGVYIHLRENAACERLIHILYLNQWNNQHWISVPRNLILLGESSQAAVLEDHLAFSDHLLYFTDVLTEIHLAAGSTLHYCKAQKESIKAYHIASTSVAQERDSHFDSFSLELGSAISRNDLEVRLLGEGTQTSLNGLYSAKGRQHIDNHTVIDHQYPHGLSRQLYKGILNGEARAVFNGKVLVRPAAQQTNSYQLNKNLLLGKDCRIDTKPQLEIGADDVKCSHGATVGQLSEEEIFYLETRAISRDKAVQMLARGFIEDILGTFQNNSVYQKMMVLLEPHFADIHKQGSA